MLFEAGRGEHTEQAAAEPVGGARVERVLPTPRGTGGGVRPEDQDTVLSP